MGRRTFQGEKAGKLRKKAYAGHKYSAAQFSPVRLPVEASARASPTRCEYSVFRFHDSIPCIWNAGWFPAGFTNSCIVAVGMGRRSTDFAADEN